MRKHIKCKWGRVATVTNWIDAGGHWLCGTTGANEREHEDSLWMRLLLGTDRGNSLRSNGLHVCNLLTVLWGWHSGRSCVATRFWDQTQSVGFFFFIFQKDSFTHCRLCKIIISILKQMHVIHYEWILYLFFVSTLLIHNTAFCSYIYLFIGYLVSLHLIWNN